MDDIKSRALKFVDSGINPWVDPQMKNDLLYAFSQGVWDALDLLAERGKEMGVTAEQIDPGLKVIRPMIDEIVALRAAFTDIEKKKTQLN